MKVNVTLIQMSAGADKEANVDRACEFVRRAADDGAEFVMLPEVFSFVADASHWRAAAEPIPGPTTERLAGIARERRIHILGGSIIEELPGNELSEQERCANTSFLIGPTGDLIATYRKMHLFRVTLPDGVVFDETDFTVPGERPVVAPTAMGSIGMTICYDLRFPELYRALMILGAGIVTVPSAFTAFTGKAHWKELLRARAIENQQFMLAPNQVGTAVTGVEFYGHSMVVDPWGTVLAEAGEEEELLTVEIDTDRIDEVRKRLRALNHVREDLLGKFPGAHQEEQT